MTYPTAPWQKHILTTWKARFTFRFSDSPDFPLEHRGMWKMDLWIPASSLLIPSFCPMWGASSRRYRLLAYVQVQSTFFENSYPVVIPGLEVHIPAVLSALRRKEESGRKDQAGFERGLRATEEGISVRGTEKEGEHSSWPGSFSPLGKSRAWWTGVLEYRAHDRLTSAPCPRRYCCGQSVWPSALHNKVNLIMPLHKLACEPKTGCFW